MSRKPAYTQTSNDNYDLIDLVQFETCEYAGMASTLLLHHSRRSPECFRFSFSWISFEPCVMQSRYSALCNREYREYIQRHFNGFIIVDRNTHTFVSPNVIRAFFYFTQT